MRQCLLLKSTLDRNEKVLQVVPPKNRCFLAAQAVQEDLLDVMHEQQHLLLRDGGEPPGSAAQPLAAQSTWSSIAAQIPSEVCNDRVCNTGILQSL